MRPFNRGLKTLITTFIVVLFAVSFLAPAVSASQWDPKSPPVYPWIDSKARTPEYDDSPWIDTNKAPSARYNFFDYFWGTPFSTIWTIIIGVSPTVTTPEPLEPKESVRGSQNGN